MDKERLKPGELIPLISKAGERALDGAAATVPRKGRSILREAEPERRGKATGSLCDFRSQVCGGAQGGRQQGHQRDTAQLRGAP